MLPVVPTVNIFEDVVFKLPFESVRIPLLEVDEDNVTPAILFIVKLFTVAGNPLPVICAVEPIKT
jgi:hypothetical protein